MVLGYHIYLTINGSGSVTKNPNKVEYDPNEIVTLIAIPSGGALFSQWSGDASGSELSIRVTSFVDDLYITATFTAIPGPPLPEPPAPPNPYGPSRGVEDFTTYKRIDPEGDITVTYSNVTWTNANRNVAASVYKTYSKGYISDFSQRLKIFLSLHQVNGAVGVWGISNGQFTLQTMINNGDGISLFWSPNENKLILRDLAGKVSDTSIVLNLSTIYYLTITRKQAVISADIYTDEARTDLVDTLSITGNPQSYSTLISYHSYNNVSFSATTSGYVEMFETLRPVTTAWLSLSGITMNLRKQKKGMK